MIRPEYVLLWDAKWIMPVDDFNVYKDWHLHIGNFTLLRQEMCLNGNDDNQYYSVSYYLFIDWDMTA